MASHCKIEWSDLPHTIHEAKATLDQLRKSGLVEREGAGYVPTTAGEDYIKAHPHHTKHTYTAPKRGTKKKGK